MIAFVIDDTIKNQSSILNALEYFNKNTPIQFIELTTEKYGLNFVASDDLCGSYLGFWGRLQEVYISPSCGYAGVLHEIMHALGFIHEQSREDRDDYIQVNWENIKEGFEAQFAILPKQWRSNDYNEDFRFDYNSIMLYSKQAFSMNATLNTIESTGNESISPSEDSLSPQDIKRVFYLYGD